MKNLRKFWWGFVMAMASVFLVPNIVLAEVNREDIIKMIAPDGQNATFKMKKPTSIEEGDFVVNGYVNSLLQLDGYRVMAGCYEEPYTNCTVDIFTDDYTSGWDVEKQEMVPLTGWGKTYHLNVTFEEPPSNEEVNEYFSKLNDFSLMDIKTSYVIEDLSLINYYMTSDKSELWNSGAPGRALKYSTINEVTKGSNVTYYLDIRAGSQDESLMYESAFGPMSIFYNGYSYGTKEEGLYLKRVIYIPETTEETKEAYIDAAQKRIDEYVGSSSIKVSYGGLISSLEEGSEDEEYPIESDGNYYHIQVGSRTYKFYIVKGSEEQLKEPAYEGLDLNSKIQITSKDSSVPLDTSLTVNDVEDSSIKEKIGTDSYKSYDISLYSAAKNTKIEKIENNKFLVKIPIPTNLSGKDLMVYYITSEGEVEEHEVSIENGYANFETDHFSVYTLAETPSIKQTDNPQTGDSLVNLWSMLMISILGIVGTGIVYKKLKD